MDHFSLNLTFNQYFIIRLIFGKTYHLNHKAMSLKCSINKVVMTREMPVFMMVQMGLKGQSQDKAPIYKFRTELSLNTPRPNFHSNEFIFNLILDKRQYKQTGSEVFALKFGLMLMPCDNFGKIVSEDYNQAKPIAVTSLNLSIQRLKELGSKPESKYFEMVDSRGKVHAQFECILEYFDNIKNHNKNDKELTGKEKQENLKDEELPNGQNILFNPLIDWMMYDQNCRDPLRQENCSKALEEQLNILYSKYHETKTQQEQLETLLNELMEDEKQLLSELEIYEKVNNKISEKLNQKQSLQALKLQIDMLRGSREGKQLLLEKVEYFQDRIFKEEELYQEAVIKYQKMKPEIEKKLKESESIAERLKGKEQQEFQIQNNEQILKNYDELLYEYKSNQQVVKSLVNLSKKSSTSEYTRQQAQIFLSQVKYEIKLEELNIEKTKGTYLTGKSQDYEEKILSMIENEMKNTQIAKEQMHSSYMQKQTRQEEEFVLKIKQESLNEQIEKIKSKISKVKDKHQMTNQFYHNKSLLSTQ